MSACSVCGGPKGGIGVPLYGDPRCMACIRAADKAETEARGEKYERYFCDFGWDDKVGGSSCTGTNWEWTRAQVADALTRSGPDVAAGLRKRWDWVRVDGPGKSMIFTRRTMPGERWGTFAPTLADKARRLVSLLWGPA